MNTANGLHLSEDRLIASLVDETSLDQRERFHLRDCAECTAERLRLERALGIMSRGAKAFTPRLRRRLTLSAHPHRRRFFDRLPVGTGWSVPWMVGAAAAVAVIVIIGGLLSKTAQERQVAEIKKEMVADARFLNDLNQLEDNTLPELSAALSDEDDSSEDDFIDFVVPDPTGDATTRGSVEGYVC